MTQKKKKGIEELANDADDERGQKKSENGGEEEQGEEGEGETIRAQIRLEIDQALYAQMEEDEEDDLTI